LAETDKLRRRALLGLTGAGAALNSLQWGSGRGCVDTVLVICPRRRTSRTIPPNHGGTGLSEQQQRSGERLFGLDVLRAAAILAVVYAHGGHLLEPLVPAEKYDLFALEGVTPFFVLSGFLIGRMLLRVYLEGMEGRALLTFWSRRWFRTLPTYFLVLALLSLFAGPGAGFGPQPRSIAAYSAFLQNLAWPHPEFFPEAWSLAVEEWFYLLTPLVLYCSTWAPKLNRPWFFLFLILLLLVASAAFRIWRVQYFGYLSIESWDQGLRKQVITRMDSLMLGVLGAYAACFWNRLWNSRPKLLLLGGIGLYSFDKIAGGVYAWQTYLNYFALTLAPFAVLLMLPWLSAWQTAGGMAARVVRTVSLISYSMYLLHFTVMQSLVLPVLWAACPTCGSEPVVRYASYWLLTLLASVALYTWFERPCTALRDRVTWFNERAARLV
jgi:peptidoglycan/LPS O-acetylase OafA/YrhL